MIVVPVIIGIFLNIYLCICFRSVTPTELNHRRCASSTSGVTLDLVDLDLPESPTVFMEPVPMPRYGE